jgi:hypothetical protein
MVEGWRNIDRLIGRQLKNRSLRCPSPDSPPGLRIHSTGVKLEGATSPAEGCFGNQKETAVGSSQVHRRRAIHPSPTLGLATSCFSWPKTIPLLAHRTSLEYQIEPGKQMYRHYSSYEARVYPQPENVTSALRVPSGQKTQPHLLILLDIAVATTRSVRFLTIGLTTSYFFVRPSSFLDVIIALSFAIPGIRLSWFFCGPISLFASSSSPFLRAAMISADFARAACASGEVMVFALVTLALGG